MKRKMLIIGLTGGIGMGKSTAAAILKELGVAVYCADEAVRGLLEKNGKAVRRVAETFPEALKNGVIDRDILARSVFHQPAKLKRLETILHPLVHKIECIFLTKARKAHARAAVLDIPLLFETGAEKRCDVTICVTAPKPVQRARVMQRHGMTKARFKAILKLQMPDVEKRRRADHIVHTGKSREDTKKQLLKILACHGLDG